MMTRRQAIKTTALASAALATLPGAIAQTNSTAPVVAPGYPFTLPPLPYAYDALEPFIDAETMRIHHDKHHAAYVANLNKALAEWPDFQTKTFDFNLEMFLKDLNSLPEKTRTAVRNNGGGHYNHSLFWQMMKKDGGGEPTGDLAKAIDTSFGSFSTFKENFSKAALGQFGSGWAWLICYGGVLKIESTPNQDTPLNLYDQVNSVYQDASLDGASRVISRSPPQNHIPLLGLDVWEHAYYLKYQNKRVD